MLVDSLAANIQQGLDLGDSKASTTIMDEKKPQIAHDSAPEFKFAIGKFKLKDGLVDISVINGHLSLLHGFSELKNDVVKFPFFKDFLKWDNDVMWKYFVNLAVERFDVWCEHLSEDDASILWEVFLPPIDVLMVWHAYLLNPLWYAEDSHRIPRCNILAKLGAHFVSALKSENLPSLLKEASEERKSFWSTCTSLDFDPETCLASFRSKPMKNLCCGQVDKIAFYHSYGSGYLQKDFSHLCSNYRNHDRSAGHTIYASLKRSCEATHKFTRDLVTDGYLAGSYLGTQEDSTHIREEGMKIKSLIISELDKRATRMNGSDEYLWGMSRTHSMYSFKKMISTPLALRIFSAYSDDKVYSIELAQAVLRQGNFVQKMKDLQWSVPGFLASPHEQIIPHAVARYHAFLDLMAVHPKTMLVPTLDIDLVWHTHQLMHSKYWDDCFKYVGRFIDHDDKVEGVHLSTSFDQTSLLWENRFKVPYTFCGCPTPSRNVVQRLSSVVKGGQPLYTSKVTPGVNVASATLATHPSEHNAVRKQRTDHGKTYTSIHIKKNRIVKKKGQKLYDSPVHHPRDGNKDHPYASTFLYPPIVLVDYMGIDGGNQCAAGYSEPYVPPPPTATQPGTSGDISGGWTSGDVGSSCGGGDSGGGGCGGGGCGGGGCGGGGD